MTTICIISDIHDWHSKVLKLELEKKNCKVYSYKFSDLRLILSRTKRIMFFKKKLKKFDGIWVRFISNGTIEEITFKLTILHLLKDLGIYIHNSAGIIEKTVDKSRTSGILKINNFETPNTWVFSEKNNLLDTKIFLNKKSLIYKPLFGSQGKGIKILKNKNEFNKIIPVGGIYYIQEFIGDINAEIFWDLRVLVSNHKVISVIKRISQNFITNAFQGAKIEKIIYDKKIREISINISKLFKLGYGGLDLKIDRNKVFILEINSIPSWKAIQSVEEKNITKILINDFLMNIKKFNNVKI